MLLGALLLLFFALTRRLVLTTPEALCDSAARRIEGLVREEFNGASRAVGDVEQASRYKAALDLQDLPESTKQVIRANYSDEQRYLEWIKAALDRKVWEEARPASR